MPGKCPCCGAFIKTKECEYCGFIEEAKETPAPEVIYKHIYVNNETPAKINAKGNSYAPNTSSKSRLVALLLCFFLGWLGIHRFYAGRKVTGLIYFFTFGLYSIGVIYDLIIILAGAFKDNDGLKLTNW